MLFPVNRMTESADRIRWPAKPADSPAAKPQDKTILRLLDEYKCESFRVSDGWAVVSGNNSTVVMFHTPIDQWEPILRKLAAL
ncbi:MAG: hypothetical protein ACHQ9S_18760 [Candidatus Binatia bacterium]